MLAALVQVLSTYGVLGPAAACLTAACISGPICTTLATIGAHATMHTDLLPVWLLGDVVAVLDLKSSSHVLLLYQ